MLRVEPIPGLSFTPPPAERSLWDAYWARLRCDGAVFGAEASSYVDGLARVIPLAARLRVLDFGCGVGLVAARLAPRVGRVALWDRSPPMRRRAARQVAGCSSASLVDLETEMPSLAAGFDVVLVNSVIQYMDEAELLAWLPRWRRLLAPGGRVVLSDVLPARRRFLELARELVDTLALQARHGLLVHAVRVRLGDLLPYARARRAAPLGRVELGRFARAARDAGLAVTVLPWSLTCRRGRLALVLTAR